VFGVRPPIVALTDRPLWPLPAFASPVRLP
jgi:hypothetical protein